MTNRWFPFSTRFPRVVLLAILTPSMLATVAFAQSTLPSFQKSFSPSTIGPGSTSTLRFDVANPTASPVRNLAFTDNLPSGMTVASPANVESTCGGSVAASSGGTSVSLSGGGVGASGSCFIKVNVAAASPGTLTNTSGDLTSDAGNSGSATATLTVDGNVPGFTKSFSPSTVAFGGRSTLTFTIDNTANSSPATNLTFTDNLPGGMTIASPANASTTCSNAIVNASSGGSVLSLGAQFPANASVGAGASCTVSVDVLGGAVGILGNTSGELSSRVGSSIVSSGKASAILTVNVERLTLAKTFTDDPVGPGGGVTLEFTVRNLDRRSSATDIAFTDDLDATLAGLVATGLPVSNVCGSGSSLSGTSVLALTGGSLAAGGSCTFSVTLQVPAGAASGAYPNTTSSVTANVGGQPTTGNPASDTLFVDAVPTLTKTFLPGVAGGGDTVAMEFTITNPSTSATATDIAFTDNLDDFISGIAVAGLPANGFCGAGSLIVVVANLGQVLTVTGGELAPGDSCTFSVDLTLPLDPPGGPAENVTSELSATVGGRSVTGNAARAALTVVEAPELVKTFLDDPVEPGATVTLEFTLSHSEEAAGDATGITFSDDLTATLAGLTTTGLPLVDVCGPGSQIDGTTQLSLTGGSLAPGETCSFGVTLQVPSTALPGDYPNTTSNVVATVAGTPTIGATASDTLQIAGLTFTKEFVDDPVIAGTDVTLRFTLENTSPTLTATGLTFTDDLGNTLQGLAATVLPPADPCGAGSSLSGGTFLIFSGGQLDPGTACSFDIVLTVPVGTESNTYNNVTSQLTATIDGTQLTFGPAADELTVASDLLSLSKEFVDDPVTPGGTVTLEFTLTNLDASRAVTDIAFTDDLDAALSGLVSVSGTSTDVCGSGSQLSGTDVLSFTGGSLAAGASCTFGVTLSVPATVNLGTVVTNTTSPVTGSTGGLPVEGDPATDNLLIEFIEFTKAFDGPTAPGGTVGLSFTLRNLSATETVTDLVFTDDLTTVIPSLAATGLPANDVCGTGSSLSGTSFLRFTGGSLLPGASCTITVELDVPLSAEPGNHTNITSNLRQGSVTATGPAIAVLVVEDLPVGPPVVSTPTVSPEPSDEGEPTTASTTFSDPAGAADGPFTCTVDYGDGTGPETGTVTLFACEGPPHVYGDNGSFTVTVVVTDGSGQTGTATTTHEVLNVAPTVAPPAVAPEPSDEGQSAAASTTFADPGTDDTPFTCTVDYGDGSGILAGTVAGSVCTGPSHVYADDGSYLVEVTVTDKDGGTGTAQTLHEVRNVSPTITATANSAAECGETPDGDSVEISVDFSDPGFDSALAGTVEDFTDSTIDWGDGTVEAATVDETPGAPGTPTTGTLSGSHVYGDSGIYTVTVTVRDDDGGLDTATLTALVTGVALLGDQLQVVGTSGADKVSVKPKKDELEVETQFFDPDAKGKGFGPKTKESFPTSDVALIEISTCAGKDTIRLHPKVDVPAILDGGDDRDLIHNGGSGASMLFGGKGRDKLFAGDSGDILDGGPGPDLLMGGRGNDILLGGTGDDHLFGRQGDDALDGGPGEDFCRSGHGNDTVVSCER